MKKKQANRNYLKNLVKEVIESPSDETNNLNDLDFEVELQNFIDSLFSVNEQGAKSSLEKLVNSGADLEDIYYAAADKMSNPEPPGFENISEQEEDHLFDGDLPKYIQWLRKDAERLRSEGFSDDADAIEELVDSLSTDGEVFLYRETGISIELEATAGRLLPDYPDRVSLKDFKGLEAQEASAHPGAGLIRLFPIIFRWGKELVKRWSGKKNTNWIKKTRRRADRARRKERSKGRRQGKIKKRNNRKREPFKRNPKPPKPPKLPKPISRWKQLAIILGVANLDELIGAVATIYENLSDWFSRGKLELLYEGSQVQYALEKFSEEGTSRTIGFQKARLYFSIFSKWDANQIDCLVEQFNTPQTFAGACADRINKPDSYFLPDDIYIALKQEEGNKLEASNSYEYIELYNRYRSIFEENVTDFVLDYIFIDKKSASMWAVIAEDEGVSAGLYLKYCFKAILDQLQYNSNNTLSEDFWRSVARGSISDYVEEDASVLDILEMYKNDFIESHFDFSDDEEDIEDVKITNQIRTHFAAVSAASMTSMVDYPGGYDSLMECLLNSNLFSESENRINYSIQSDFVRTLLSAFIGGAMDSKAAALLWEAGKKLLNKAPDPKDAAKGASGLLFGGIFLAEMSFYFLDPFNIYSRHKIEARFETIRILLKEEAEHFASQDPPVEKWYMREEQTELVRKEIDLIYEEILDEMNATIVRFYDMMKTEESACQQLQDKVRIRNAAFKQITLFKQASFEGLRTHPSASSDFHKYTPIKELTINYQNYSHMIDAIPAMKETLVELHKQIAVPEVGLFMMVPMTPPEDVIRTLKDPMAVKTAAEAEDKREIEAEVERARYCAENPMACVKPGFMGLPESGKLTYLNKYILNEQNITAQARNKRYRNRFSLLTDKNYPSLITTSGGVATDDSLIGNLIWEEEAKDEVKKILTSIAVAAGVFRYDDIMPKNLQKRLNIMSKVGYRKKLSATGDIDVSNLGAGDEDIPGGFSDLHPDYDVEEIIEKGRENFKKSLTSNSKYFKHRPISEHESKGYLIELPIHRYVSSNSLRTSGLFSGKYVNRWLLIASPRIGISMKYPDIAIGRPVLETYPAATNITTAGKNYLDKNKQLYNLFNEEIKAEETYKIIYDPKDIKITKTGSGDLTQMTNLSYINNSKNMPVVDMLVPNFTFNKDNRISYGGLISKEWLKSSKLDLTADGANAVKEILERIHDIKNSAYTTKVQLQDLQSEPPLVKTKKYISAFEELQTEYNNSNIVKDNVHAANVLINLCNIGISMFGAYYAADQEFGNLKLALARIHTDTDMGMPSSEYPRDKKGGRLKDRNGDLVPSEYEKATTSISNIQNNIDSIKKLYFVRPAGFIQKEDHKTIKDIFKYSRDDAGQRVKVGSANLVTREDDPQTRYKADVQRASRYMYEEGLESIIENNKAAYENIVKEIQALNKYEVGDLDISESDSHKLLIKSMLNIIHVDKTLAEAAFSWHTFINSM